MKKVILISSLFLMLAIVVNAQEDYREKFTVGAKVGMSYSNVYDAEGEEFDADAKFGLTGGAFVVIPIGKFLGIQPEILITQKGFKGSGTLLFQEYSFKRTTTFLEVPLLLAVKPSEFITVLVGPQFSYLLKQRDVFDSSIISYDQEQEFEQDDVRKNIMGFVGGFDITLSHIVVSARIGLDFQTNKGDGNPDTPRYKNLCTQLGVGYKF